MDQPLTNEESYAERRKLFKNIWETAMKLDDKEGNIMAKPKVIKTLRLDEVDKCAGRKKKQRIKNLRTVCTKILDFCDRQDADDLFYEQLATDQEPIQHKVEVKIKKFKIVKTRRKIKKAKSFSPTNETAHVTISKARNSFHIKKKNSKSNSAVKNTDNNVVKRPTALGNRNSKIIKVSTCNHLSGGVIISRHKILKKKRSSRNKVPDLNIIPGILDRSKL